MRTHTFVPDGIAYIDKVRRCAEPTGDGEWCSMPESNRVHHLQDVSEAQEEHRRRAGEHDARAA